MEHLTSMRRTKHNSGKLISKITNEENEWDQIADADTVEGPIVIVTSEEIVEAFKHLKIGKAPWPSEFYAEVTLATGEV